MIGTALGHTTSLSDHPEAMRANFPPRSSPQSTPNILSRELDATTPKPGKEQGSAQGSPPMLYDSAAKEQGISVQSASPPSSGGREAAAQHQALQVHEIYSPAARSPTALFHDNFRNSPEVLHQLKSGEPSAGRVQSTPGDASGLAPITPATMADQRSSGQDFGKSPTSRGRSYSSTRGTQSRQQPPAPQFPPQGQYAPSGVRDATSSPPSFPSLHGQYQPPPAPFTQHGPYMGGPYAMSPPPVSVGMHQQSAPQYAYTNRPGLTTQDSGMHPQNQMMGYSSNTLLPVYGYSTHAHPDGPSSSSSFASSPGGTVPLYSPPIPSPSPHSPHFPPGSSPYGARYSTPTYVGYPPHSFSQSGSALYQGQYSYGQQYRPPGPGEPEGTWWYMPPGSGPPPTSQYEAYANPYPVYSPIAQHEMDYNAQTSQAQSGPAHPPTFYPMSSNHPTLPQYPTSAPPQPHRQLSPDPPPALRDQQPRAVSEPSEAPSSSSALSRATQDPRPAAHRSPHANPSSNRSEWVMWAGNVPSDASYDELWDFFTGTTPSVPTASSMPSQTPGSLSRPPPVPLPPPTTSGAGAGPTDRGVSSVFLISRSNCAFVNFFTEAHLQAAIAHFNGTPLRPGDPRCPRLVCRMRNREDDLKAGVGGQRGAGIHMRWVREQNQRQRRAAGSPEPPPSVAGSEAASDLTDLVRSVSLSSDDHDDGRARRLKRSAQHSSSSGSYASTNSSLLSQYFPKRYFILKSLTQFDLDLSVEKGLWATQRHNEGILDQAFRTSKDVYLIFGVNKSGEFYGYAKMAGPILRGEQRVSWASRSSTDSSPGQRASTSGAGTSPTSSRRPQYLSPSERDRYEESPLPMDMSPLTEKTSSNTRATASAPAIMHEQHRRLSKTSGVQNQGSFSYDEKLLRPAATALLAAQEENPDDFELDPSAPARHAKHAEMEPHYIDADGIRRWDAAVGESLLESVEEEEEHAHGEDPPTGAEGDNAQEAQGRKEDGPVWGESFKVEWIRATRLPFYRTRHLRNPWNHDREVKVSRDGTELEPGVGQALLEEWDRPESHEPPRAGARSTPADRAAGKD